MELENNEEGNGKGNKKRIAIIAVVVAAIIAVVVAAFLLLSPHEPEASSIKDAATTTQEQLDEEAMKSRLWVSVANTIYADSATDTLTSTSGLTAARGQKETPAVLPAGERKEREEERVQLSGTSRFLVGLFLLTIHI